MTDLPKPLLLPLPATSEFACEWDRLMRKMFLGDYEGDTLYDLMRLTPYVTDVVLAVRMAIHYPDKDSLARMKEAVAILESVQRVPRKEDFDGQTQT